MAKTGKLFVISAPSGTGKTTLCKKLFKALPNLVRSISVTTRSLRDGEQNNREYFFVDEKDFKKSLSKGYFLEYAKVFDNYYGTPREFVEKNLKQNNDVVLAIDVQGAMQVMKNFRSQSEFIFILPPTINDLRERLLSRHTETEIQIQHRLAAAKKEMSYVKKYDHQIINDNLEEAFKKLLSIINRGSCKI